MALLFFVVFIFAIAFAIVKYADDYQTEQQKKESEACVEKLCEEFLTNGFAKDMSNRISSIYEANIAKFLNPNNAFLARNNYNPEFAKCLLCMKISIGYYGISIYSNVSLNEMSGRLSEHYDSYISFATIRNKYLNDDEVKALKMAICRNSRKWKFRNNEVFINEKYWENYILNKASKLQNRF